MHDSWRGAPGASLLQLDPAGLAIQARAFALRATQAAPMLAALNFADDTAAAAGGVPVGSLYHSAGTVKVRLV